MDDFYEFLKTYQLTLITSLIIIGLTVLLSVILSFIFNRIIKKQKNKRSITVTKLIRSIIKYTITIIVFIVLLGVWGVNIMPIVTGVGILGLVIGLGAQTLIKDLIAGIAIVFDNFYDIGEVVEIKGFKGTVLEVGLKSTRIVNWKGQVKIFSNGEITEVINFSRNPSIGVVEFEVAYQEDINKIYKIIEDGLKPLRDLYPQIIEGPSIKGISSFNNIVKMSITVKTQTEQHYDVERGIRKLLKEIFEQHKIAMPYTNVIFYESKNTN